MLRRRCCHVWKVLDHQVKLRMSFAECPAHVAICAADVHHRACTKRTPVIALNEV
jgi:hypothetical protein